MYVTARQSGSLAGDEKNPTRKQWIKKTPIQISAQPLIDGGLNKVRRTINGVSLGRTQNTCAIARPVWVIAVAECLRPAG
jgi:hypothetical protein